MSFKNFTRPSPRDQPVTLTGQPLDEDEVALWLATPGVVTGYRDADGNPILTSLDELADSAGGGA